MWILEVIGSVVRLLGAILGIFLGTFFLKHRAVRVFRRTLRRTGLTVEETDQLTERFDLSISLRDLVRTSRCRVT